MIRRIHLTCLALVAVFLAEGCDANRGDGSAGAGGIGATSSSSTSGMAGVGGSGGSIPNIPDGGWGEPDLGALAGPIDFFKAFRSGCDKQLWMRFIPIEDFGVHAATVTGPGGMTQSTYFDVPVFKESQKSVWLYSNDGGFLPGNYHFDLTVETQNGSTLTHGLDVPADGLFRWPEQIDYQDSRNDPVKGLQVTVKPNISGDVQRMFLYDANECPITSKTLVSPISITSGVPTEIDIGTMGLTTGATYTLVLEGFDNARQYDFYATLDVVGP